MWFGSATNLSKLSSVEKLIKLDQTPFAVISDLRVFFDYELNMKSHINRITRACFYHLCCLRAVRRQLGREVTARLVSAFV